LEAEEESGGAYRRSGCDGGRAFADEAAAGLAGSGDKDEARFVCSAAGNGGGVTQGEGVAGKFQFDKVFKVDNFMGMSRLTIEIEPEQHRQIKTLATFSGMTIKEFILSKTIGSPKGEAVDFTDRLMKPTKNAARLREAIATPESEHRVFETIEDLKDALGI